MTVSILMAVYNGAATLEPAIRSVLDQDYGDWELVAVDDGSTDGTAEILARFAALDSRIKPFRQDNKGLTLSLNVAIERAQGEYLARLDADDQCLPGRLRRQVAFLDANPEIGLVGGNFILIDETGNPYGRSSLGTLDHDECVHRLKTLAAFFPHSSWMMRRSLAGTLDGYAPWAKKGQDYEFLLRAVGVARLACLEAPVIRLRKAEGSATFDSQFTQYRTALTAWLETFGETGRPRRDLAAAVDRWFERNHVGRKMLAVQHATFALAALKRLRLARFARLAALALFADPLVIRSYFWLRRVRLDLGAHLLAELEGPCAA